jgi:excinuclease ABC subunit C
LEEAEREMDLEKTGIEKKVASLPLRPGVYLFLDEKRNVIYVGKAKSLRKRVQSYFRHGGFASPRLRKLVSSIRDISFIRTETEAEALITEARLIKQYQPFFNIDLKMGERYPYVKITNEPFPRIVITRHREEGDGADYIGPFVSAGELRQMLRLVERFFPLRICRTDSRDGKWAARPCVRYDLGRCLGPCAGLADPSEYRERVADIVLLLRGQSASLVGRLRERMDKASASLDFETAGRLRDTIRAIWRLSRRHVSLVFSDPLDGRTWKSLTKLQEELSLPDLPWRIEGFDVSHFAGGEAYGVCVVFEQGLPNPSLYRRYKIRTVEGVDDFRSMAEILERRYKRLLDESGVFPQLILIDGGRGQLSFAVDVLKSLGLADIPVAAIAEREELIFVPDREEPIALPRESEALMLLQRVRDESHRFALAANRRAGRKRMSRSSLEDVPGIGKILASRLLSRFGSVARISTLAPEEIASVRGVGAEAAKRIIHHLGGRESDDGDE